MTRPVLERVAAFAELIEDMPAGGFAYDQALQALRSSERTGRSVGTRAFVADLERRLGRPLAPRGRGRKPAATASEQPALL